VIGLGDVGGTYVTVTGRAYPPQEDQGSSADRRYFPETGQYVQAGFLAEYDLLDGPNTLGLPLSGELSEGGRTVQYFAKGRLEWVPALGGARFGAVGADYVQAVGLPG
jgi:uncharacterized protein with LGFP repeats